MPILTLPEVAGEFAHCPDLATNEGCHMMDAYAKFAAENAALIEELYTTHGADALDTRYSLGQIAEFLFFADWLGLLDEDTVIDLRDESAAHDWFEGLLAENSRILDARYSRRP